MYTKNSYLSTAPKLSSHLRPHDPFCGLNDLVQLCLDYKKSQPDHSRANKITPKRGKAEGMNLGRVHTFGPLSDPFQAQ